MLSTGSATVSLPKGSSSDEAGRLDAMWLSPSSLSSLSQSMSARNGVRQSAPLGQELDWVNDFHRDADVAELIGDDHDVVLRVGVAG